MFGFEVWELVMIATGGFWASGSCAGATRRLRKSRSASPKKRRSATSVGAEPAQQKNPAQPGF